MSYSTEITTHGKLDDKKVFKKMTRLFEAHKEQGSPDKLAKSIAFDYGRELIGFDKAEQWAAS